LTPKTIWQPTFRRGKHKNQSNEKKKKKGKEKKEEWFFGAQSELLNPQMLHVAVDRGKTLQNTSRKSRISHCRPVHASSKFGGLSHVQENFSIFFLFH
jgi:hypothetical protein